MTQPTLLEATKVWLKIGLLSFGGPAAQIALMHREVVEERSWLSEQQYLNALSFCMLLPGPEAMQLATYAGWRMHGTLGGLIAGLLFVLPGAAAILGLALIYALLGDLPLISALFLGVKAVVVIIVIEALLRVAKRALHLPEHWVIAALAFVAIFFFSLPYPLIIAVAAIFGFFRSGPSVEAKQPTGVNHWRSLLTTVLWFGIWWIPLILVALVDHSGMMQTLAVFFSKLAMVTFGGAYAVLAYMGQDVVGNLGWLTAGEMMDGLGLAETTPGPLILVTEFVGFLAAFNAGGVWLGVLGATVTLWATFAPCFLWIFVGAPYIDWIGNQPRLMSALKAITAAVVGVILNLSIWFALHVFFTEVAAKNWQWLTIWTPELSSLDWRVVVLSVAASILLFKFHWGLIRILGLAALAGVGLSFL